MIDEDEDEDDDEEIDDGEYKEKLRLAQAQPPEQRTVEEKRLIANSKSPQDRTLEDKHLINTFNMTIPDGPTIEVYLVEPFDPNAPGAEYWHHTSKEHLEALQNILNRPTKFHPEGEPMTITKIEICPNHPHLCVQFITDDL